MKIGVLFNCQNVGIAASLRDLLPGHEVVNYRFVDVRASEAAAASAGEVLRRCDVLVTTPTGANLHAAEPAALAAAGVRVLTIPHVIFGGYHPDTCYSPDPVHGIAGPTERFHSRIAACAFLAGLDIEDTLALYSKLPFARLGYFDYYAPQRAAMIEQWASYGIDLSPWFARWAARGCFMYSMNHPKIYVLHDVARIICKKLGLTTQESGELPPDNMLLVASHPVYADLAEVLGVAPESHFRRPTTEGREASLLDMRDFLTRSFAAFGGAKPGVVRDLGGVPDGMLALDLRFRAHEALGGECLSPQPPRHS